MLTLANQIKHIFLLGNSKETMPNHVIKRIAIEQHLGKEKDSVLAEEHDKNGLS